MPARANERPYDVRVQVCDFRMSGGRLCSFQGTGPRTGLAHGPDDELHSRLWSQRQQ